MISDKHIIIGVIIFVIAVILFMGCFTEESPFTLTISETREQSSTKLHEGDTGSSSIMWDNCCEGYVNATFTYNWDFYFEDVEDDYNCDDDVDFIVYDSLGREAFTSSSDEPDSGTKTFTGYWDCLTPWEVTVYNGCIPPITVEWTLKLECE